MERCLRTKSFVKWTLINERAETGVRLKVLERRFENVRGRSVNFIKEFQLAQVQIKQVASDH